MCMLKKTALLSFILVPENSVYFPFGLYNDYPKLKNRNITYITNVLRMKYRKVFGIEMKYASLSKYVHQCIFSFE